MKVALEFPDEKAAFVMELLQSIPYLKAKPLGRRAKPQDETEYLLSNPANAQELQESIEQIRRGQTVQRELLD